jgi:predicted nucleotidyltransferase component of viral defense system
MVQLKEDKNFYASPIQRSILVRLADNDVVSERFFLTGGTALSVFYLHHRTSDDLDFFTVESIDLSDIYHWIRTVWQNDQQLIRSSPEFLSLLIHNIKIECVIDSLSERSERPRVLIDDKSIAVDTISNIGVNKFCTIVSRTEPKDYIDFYYLFEDLSETKFEKLYQEARKREALFDDPPTAAFQIEEGIRFIREHPQLLSHVRSSNEPDDLLSFFENVAKKLYKRQK